MERSACPGGAMLTAFKKLVGGEGGSPLRPPSGMQAMEQSLQKRFARGVQYNMKIVIKGDRNVGKSCLLLRLQGLPFKEEYLPTDEIQVASIQWSYKATDDVVKVEVWDVVDRGKKRPPIQGLKLDNSAVATPPGVSGASAGGRRVRERSTLSLPRQVPEEAALDAEFIDVYKGTNGVLMMLDITKQWTFDYVQRELPKVPANIPVLVLANHLDMKHHRNITEDQVKFYVESVERPPGSAQIRYAESSLRNGFGLKFLYKWFNLPFLQLQVGTSHASHSGRRGKKKDGFHEKPTAELFLKYDLHCGVQHNDLRTLKTMSRHAGKKQMVETLLANPTQVVAQTKLSPSNNLCPCRKLCEAMMVGKCEQTIGRSLLQQLERNGQETGATTQELDLLQESEEQSYDLFVEALNSRRRQLAEQLSSAPPQMPNGLPSSATNCALSSLGEASQAKAAARSVSVPSSLAGAGGPSRPAASPAARPAASPAAPASQPPVAAGAPSAGPVIPTKQAIMSRLFSRKEGMVVTADVHPPPLPPPVNPPVHNVDDFVPDGDASFSSFLEDADAAAAPAQQEESASEDDSSGGGNPLVRGFQDDVDPEDVRPPAAPDLVGRRQEWPPAQLGTAAAAGDAPAAPTEPAYWHMPSEDLSFLEKRYTGSQPGSTWKLGGAPVPVGDAPEEDSTPVPKHKKHRHKKEDTERRHRKDRAKEKSSSKDKDEPGGDRGERKKSHHHRKQRKPVEESSSDAERLEAFLGAADEAGVERAVEAYESL
ncbi:hypothetical protein HPB48_020276 [Haemaphysalis longicornis]|uniref:Rab-like protein 6 n=1 Tax=Haemaphysalis longicornis TaxID=44386 RepID=A0A9J6FBU9_HAELO|nr:hypothetical protein HPB48_020276 [Haemaphysalis longicornis]